MKDSERISNLEEMTAEILMRLDRIDAELVRLRKGQSQANDGMESMTGRMDSMEGTMRELAKYMFELNDRQTMVEETMRDISLTNRLIFERMATKDDLVKLFDYMTDRFHATDTRFEKIDKRLDNLENRLDSGLPDSPQS